MKRNLHRKVFEKINELKWRASCESDTFETQVIFPILARTLLARTLFPVKSTNNIKIKIPHHRVIGDGCIWEGISLMKAC